MTPSKTSSEKNIFPQHLLSFNLKKTSFSTIDVESRSLLAFDNAKLPFSEDCHFVAHARKNVQNARSFLYARFFLLKSDVQ
jgi:hypothetical protein